MNNVEFDLHCKAFTGQKSTLQRLSVDGDTVRVHDPIAHHFTTCHALSATAIRRAKKIAVAAKLAAEVLGTPSGSWADTQHSMERLVDALPDGLTAEDAMTIARDNGAHIHPGRQ
jgi:hypothetical protein